MEAEKSVRKHLYTSANSLLLDAAMDRKDNGTERLQQALEAGANINTVSLLPERWGTLKGVKYTALMYAANNGQLEKVKFLLERGANAFTTTGRGNTAIHLAAREGHNEVVDCLAAYNPQLLHIKGEDGKTVEAMAASYNKTLSSYFQMQHSNPFFPTRRGNFPDDLALRIVHTIGIPTALKNLPLVNKAWHSICNDDSINKQLEQLIKPYLRNNLDKTDWLTIFKCYFPQTKLETQDPNQVFKEFMQRFNTFYIVGHEISTPVKKGVLKRATGFFVNRLFEQSEGQSSEDKMIKAYRERKDAVAEAREIYDGKKVLVTKVEVNLETAQACLKVFPTTGNTVMIPTSAIKTGKQLLMSPDNTVHERKGYS